VLHVAPAEYHADVTVSAAQATLMMTLCQPTPPRVIALDVLVTPCQLCLWRRLSILLMSPCRVLLRSLMMTLCQPTPPRVMTLDVLVTRCLWRL
jgi:hypothetical protein